MPDTNTVYQHRGHFAALLLCSITLLASACSKPASSYADDRAQVENLLARYCYALDWQDADTYASVFTEDGVLDWAGGIAKGHEAIRKEVVGMRDNFARLDQQDAPLRPAHLRHFITNVVLEVNGDTARSRDFWVEFNNRDADRKAYSGAFGHGENELRKVNGQWLLASRKIFNEEMAERTASPKNPAW